MSETGTITVRHHAEGLRYELLDGDAVVGEAHYRPFEDPSGPQRIFYHTVVDESYGGQGLGSRLATFALEDTAAAGLAVVPVCPYISAFLKRHPEHAANAVAVRHEHLEAVRRA